jgi:hypothetical protein
MNRILLKSIFVFYCTAFSITGSSLAQIISITQYSLDFTDVNELHKKAAIWYEAKNVNLTEEGLTLKAQENASADVRIQVTEPIGVGLSWRPAQSVNIEAEVNPPGKFVFRENAITYPTGSLYVCYSADAQHWSNWQLLKMDIPKDHNEPKQKYSGTISVTQTQRQEYYQLLMQYIKMDVTWSSDEEATVKWIVQNNPDFFEKPAPFIGYVRFLYELQLKGGQIIRNINFNIHWAVGGAHSLPKDEQVYKQRMNSMEPWRYKAPSYEQKS